MPDATLTMIPEATFVIPQENNPELTVPRISRITYRPNKLFITWDFFKVQEDMIDPLIELFRPVRDRLCEETDLYVVILPTSKDHILPDGSVERHYIFTCCPKKRKNVPGNDLMAELDRYYPFLIDSFDSYLHSWIQSRVGLNLFMEEKNKDSIKKFISSMDFPYIKLYIY